MMLAVGPHATVDNREVGRLLEGTVDVTEGAAREGAAAGTPSTAPPRSGLVLIALILVAGVANLNLSVANVALPDIAQAFDSSQTMLNLIAVGYSLGLAASVLYLGALGDRYGRKLMLLLGMALSIPACLLAAWAPSDEGVFGARVLGGLSARHGLPDDARLDRGVVVGAGAYEVDRSVVRLSEAASPLSGRSSPAPSWSISGGGQVFLVTLPLSAWRS